jgi:hypothetical protein
MNKLYVLVLREPHEGDCIFGVYSTKENAQKALDEVQKGCYGSKYLLLQVIPDQEPDWNSAIALKYLKDSDTL